MTHLLAGMLQKHDAQPSQSGFSGLQLSTNVHPLFPHFGEMHVMSEGGQALSSLMMRQSLPTPHWGLWHTENGRQFFGSNSHSQ